METAPHIATILCIDDEPDALRIRKQLLESEGYFVVEANTGPEGLRLLQETDPNLAIVDYWMSGMKGLAVATEIRRLRPEMPIIILSGYGELPGEASGIANRWILKGQPASVLLNAIKTLLSAAPSAPPQ